jgi:hypothetical protein
MTRPRDTANRCINCGWPALTWAETRRSYGRMIGHGLTQAEAKKLSPRCYRCTTTLLATARPATAERHPSAPVAEVGEVSDPRSPSIALSLSLFFLPLLPFLYRITKKVRKEARARKGVHLKTTDFTDTSDGGGTSTPAPRHPRTDPQVPQKVPAPGVALPGRLPLAWDEHSARHCR